MYLFHHPALPQIHRRSTHHQVRCALPPKRIAAVAKDLQKALQQTLTARHSRLSIRLPPGAKLGTEARRQSESKEEATNAGDREVARLIAGMFENTGLEVCVVFEKDAQLARKIWGGVECDIVQWGKKMKEKRGGKGGFGEKKSGDGDVLICVGESAGFWDRVRNEAGKVGMEKLIIVVNVRKDGLPVDLKRELERFEVVYHYEPNPHPVWNGGVLFRRFPDDWVLCRITPIGTLQTLLEAEQKPELEAIARALQQAQSNPGLLDRVTSLFNPKD